MDCLGCLSAVLEYAPLDKSIGKHTDELLSYLKSTFTLDPVSTLKTVQTLLRCIFGTNVANQGYYNTGWFNPELRSRAVFWLCQQTIC